MRLIEFHVKNYRSIVDSGRIRIERLQAFVGENNAGKSNLLYALQVFLTSGTGGVMDPDFFDKDNPIIITTTFGELTSDERRRLRPYLLGDRLILRKEISLQEDERSGKVKPTSTYHGYLAKPRDWWLSVEGVIDRKGQRPKWEQVATEHGIIDYVRDNSGRVNKTSYGAGLKRVFVEREDVEYEEPVLGQTQTLGLQPVLLKWLPRFYILPAITDYSDEIDKRVTNTAFRRLMGDLADRILRFDPRFRQIESSLKTLASLLNAPEDGEQREERQERLSVLENIETELMELIRCLMPSVSGVRLKVLVEPVGEIFSRGVSINIDDGVLTEVVTKGHGLQRCLVFALIQALIKNQRGTLIPDLQDQAVDGEEAGRPIILAIEEPELYIHPQMQRLVYGVLKGFAATDQIVYTTHCPAFVDIARYDSVGVVRKECVEYGTCVRQCASGDLAELTERKTFQFLSSFGVEQNQLFFARQAILVEGEEDIIGIIATGRELKLFKEFPEELGRTLVATDCKQEMKKYMKLLNGFGIPYVILHELDGQPNSSENQEIRDLLKGNKSVELPKRLEDVAGHRGHFGNKYAAKKWFENSAKMTNELKKIVGQLFD
jgi:putative ATP-dependent endonuclease of OLD family